jgi:hypothetical protein
MDEEIISKPIYQVLTELTQQTRIDVALPLAVKDWLRLKLKEARDQSALFAERYGMDFAAFERAWQADQIANKHSYEVEHDYWEWEAAETDRQRLQHMLESLP